MFNLTSVQTFATQLAHQAGQLLTQAYHAQEAAQASRRASPKAMKLIEDTTMDQWLIQHIQQHYPDHHIITEESGAVNPMSDTVWIIDPIDGSVNFSTHNPFVAISLAVMHQNELVLGVVEAPLLGEQFVARRGQGATVNGQLVHVSATAQLSQAYLVSCDGGITDRTQVFSTTIRNYYDQVTDFRKLGSAALECAWVASGRADAYITMAIDPWDVAAGVLLIQEAGGIVTTFEGRDWEPKQLDIVCSNGLLHHAVMERLWG